MTGAPDPGPDNEEFWRDFLTRGDAMERRVRGIFKLIPQGRDASCVPRHSPASVRR